MHSKVVQLDSHLYLKIKPFSIEKMVGISLKIGAYIFTLDAVIIKNTDFSHGGFWWSIHGSNQVNMTDITFSHDKMSMIQVVNDCHVKAGWDEEINFNQYGWHKGGDGKLSFNEAGFRAGDVFASCSFESSPPSLLKWDSDYVAEGASLGKVDAKVPAHRLLADSITCSVEVIKIILNFQTNLNFQATFFY